MLYLALIGVEEQKLVARFESLSFLLPYPCPFCSAYGVRTPEEAAAALGICEQLLMLLSDCAMVHQMELATAAMFPASPCPSPPSSSSSAPSSSSFSSSSLPRSRSAQQLERYLEAKDSTCREALTTFRNTPPATNTLQAYALLLRVVGAALSLSIQKVPLGSVFPPSVLKAFPSPQVRSGICRVL